MTKTQGPNPKAEAGHGFGSGIAVACVIAIGAPIAMTQAPSKRDSRRPPPCRWDLVIGSLIGFWVLVVGHFLLRFLVIGHFFSACDTPVMLITDAHLDLSYNALAGRDVLKPAVDQPADGPFVPTVGLPDLQKGGVGLICATVFTEPTPDVDKAYAEGQKHLDWYRRHESAGTFKFAKSADDLVRPHTGQLAIMLMEGADPLRTPADVADWHAAGLRAVGLAWKQTRYAGGTGDPGPLTAAGIELVPVLDQFGIVHDTSHLAEQSFWQLLDIATGPVMASHSNCRAFVPTDRQLSDDMIRAIIARGGVIGINFFDKFLLRPGVHGTRRANLADVVEHIKHICDLAGSADHAGLGTDMDGGLGRDQIPVEIVTSADLPKTADALSAGGFDDAAVEKIMGTNWVRFFTTALK
jgi:membrane dipeptidase